MKRTLSRLHIALAIVIAALAIGVFPATANAEGVNYWPPYPSSYGCSYMIHFGDTMSSVAVRYGTSVWSLARLNGTQNPNLIYAGMAMRVPCAPGGYSYGPPYQYLGMYQSRGMYSYPGAYQYRSVYQYHGTYSYPTQPYLPYSYSPPSYPSQGYPMQPYAPTGYPTPVPMMTPMATGQVMVVMRNIAFNPSTVTIRVGQTVVWRNDDAAPHTTTSGTCPGGVCTPMAGWDSGTLNPGQSFAHQFNTPGTFSYYCRIHGAMMQGTVMVMP